MPLPFLSANVIATIAGVSAETIRRSIREGELQAKQSSKGYMVPLDEAKEYLQQRGVDLEKIQDIDMNKKDKNLFNLQDLASKLEKGIIAGFSSNNSSNFNTVGPLIGTIIGFSVATLIKELIKD